VNRLLVLAADAEAYSALLSAANLQKLELVTAVDADSAEAVVDTCNIILGDPSLVSTVLDSARNLEWVQSSWAGVDQLCQAGMRRDYALTGLKGIFGPLISEYVMTYLYAFERQVFTMLANQARRCWRPLPYRPSKEISLGIIGLGSIGRHLARTARQFGIRVTGLNRSGRPCEDVERVYTMKTIAEFLEKPDYVVLTLPDTPNTRHFINAGTLKMMKTSAVLINVGRGSLICESDLVASLHGGGITGAVLDVFENEPLGPESPLWQIPNVYITPHNAATSFPEEIVEIFAANYQRFVQKRPLLNIVDFELGY